MSFEKIIYNRTGLKYALNTVYRLIYTIEIFVGSGCHDLGGRNNIGVLNDVDIRGHFGCSEVGAIICISHIILLLI